MKSLMQLTHTVPANQTVTEPVPLHRLIDQLMVGLLPLVTGKKSFIINDVDQTFHLQADENLLALCAGQPVKRRN